MGHPRQCALTADASITVVIPTHNRSQLVRTAIASVLDQGGESLTVVVVDDGSDDDTCSALASYDDPRLTVIPQEHAGVGSARNRGVRESCSEFVCFLDSDDVVLDGWADTMSMAARRGIDLFSCGVEFVFADGSSEAQLPRTYGAEFEGRHALFLAGAFMVRRSVFERAGGYLEGLRLGENSDLGMRICDVGRRTPLVFSSTDDVLARAIRSTNAYGPEILFESSQVVLRHSLPLLAKNPKALATYFAIGGVAASRLGRRRDALTMLGRAVGHDPLNWRHSARFVRAALQLPSNSSR